jgi:hypothetical protein
MKYSAQKPTQSWGTRLSISAATGILLLFSALVSPAAAAHEVANDWFYGAAIVPAGQTSPVSVDPRDMSFRADGAIGFGYTYRAAGQAFGRLPGSFTYLEHGYIYFKNPADPKSMVGSRFVSGVFTLLPNQSHTPVQIADTAPDKYTSGIQTVVEKLGPREQKSLSELLGQSGSLTYGYFTFTNNHGTFTGYATPDFTRFIIPLTFDY